jgi:hypothetical protein
MLVALWVCSFIGTDRSGPVPKAFVYWYCWDRKMELSNSRFTEWRGTVRLLGTVPVPVRTNKRTHPLYTYCQQPIIVGVAFLIFEVVYFIWGAYTGP